VISSLKRIKRERKVKTWVGIDVSKLTLDVCWFEGGEPTFLKVANGPAGFAALYAKLPALAHLVMEATGAYYLRLAHFLMGKDLPVSVVNPISIKRYAQMKLSRVKTDKYDAALIARYGASQEPAAWTLPDTHILEMQQLCALEDDLIVQKGMLLNQKEAFTQNPFASKTALKCIQGLVKRLMKEMAILRKRLNELTEAHYPREAEILCSIPGLGTKTAQALIVVTKGFREEVNGRRLCSYVGLSPRPFQSGTSVRGRGHISKMGSRSVRKKLYMCAISAIRNNPACKVFYERLKANGKASKVALIAVCGKLLRQAGAMIKKDQLFDEKLAMGA
jgi:transposase